MQAERAYNVTSREVVVEELSVCEEKGNRQGRRGNLAQPAGAWRRERKTGPMRLKLRRIAVFEHPGQVAITLSLCSLGCGRRALRIHQAV